MEEKNVTMGDLIIKVIRENQLAPGEENRTFFPFLFFTAGQHYVRLHFHVFCQASAAPFFIPLHLPHLQQLQKCREWTEGTECLL